MDGVVEELVALEALGQPERLMLPLVAEHQVEVAERQRRQRLLRLGLDQLGSQLWCLGSELLHGGQREVSATDWKVAIRRAPGDRARGGGEVGLGAGRAIEQRVGVADQHERRVGQPHAATRLLEQRHAGLALEHRELLRDGARRELERVGDGGDRPPLVQLLEQPQPTQFEHVGNLPNYA